MKAKKTTKAKNNPETNILPLLTGFSAALTVFFLVRVFVLVQDLKQEIQGAPNSFIFWPALGAALYVFMKSKNQAHKYIALVVCTVLIVGMLVWFFGVTNAVDLQTNY